MYLFEIYSPQTGSWECSASPAIATEAENIAATDEHYPEPRIVSFPVSEVVENNSLFSTGDENNLWTDTDATLEDGASTIGANIFYPNR